MVAIPGPRCQYVAASGLLASVAGSCAGCFEACHEAEPANGGPVTKRGFFENMVWTKEPPENNELHFEGVDYWAGQLQTRALMPILDLFCRNPCFMLLESAPPVTLPSCAVSVSGALRHGAP